MKVGIIGGGAIGLLTASYLSSCHEVTLYVRKAEQVEEMNSYGFTRVGLNGENKHFFVKAKLLDDLESEQVLIICVKQYSLSTVIDRLKRHETIPIIFLQNGMGHEHLALSLANPLYIGITDHGARKINSLQIAHTGAGRVLLGCIQGENITFSRIKSELNSSEFPVLEDENWRDVQRWKLVANAVINPITALFGVKNGALIINEELQKMAKEVCCEAASALDINASEAWEHCSKIIETTSTNRSSMLQDIDAERKTEIESILGYLICQGKEEYPIMQFLHRSIKALESESARKQAPQ